MKKFFFTISMMALLAAPIAFANSEDEKELSLDELKEKIEKGKDDSVKVLHLEHLSAAYIYIKPDSAMFYAKEGLELAEKIKWEPGAAMCLNDIGATQQFMGNYPQALDAFLRALKISEERNDKRRMTWSLDCVGNLYIAQGEYRKGLKYLFEEKEIQESLKDEEGLVYSLFNISIAYQHLNEAHKNSILLDSSLFYQQWAYRIAKHKKKENEMLVPEMVAPSLINLATIEELKGNHAVALSYYRGSISFAAEHQDSVSFCQIYGGLAEIYKNQKQYDSAFYYGKKGLVVAQNLSFTDGILNSCKVLSEAYRAANMSDSTVKFLDLTIATKDSLFNQTKVKQLQTLGFNEELRQQEIEAEKERQEEEHMENLKMLGLAVFVIFIFVFVLSISHIKINPKAIETFGVVSVLMVFEFVSMFLHPIIEEWTHHSVFLVFLILVGVANILVPLHHKLEHWMKHTIGKRKLHAHSHITPDGKQTVQMVEDDNCDNESH